MKPTASLSEAAAAPSHKSSIVGDRRPSLSSGQPTSFFLAREEDVFGPATSFKTEEVRSSMELGSQANVPNYSKESSGLSEDSAGTTPQADSTYGVQSLEDALGQAFGDKTKDEQEGSLAGIAGLLKRKRRAPSNPEAERVDTLPLPVAAEEASSSKHSSPQNRAHQHMSRISRSNTISQPLTPLQLESPLPLPSTPKSGSFRSLRLSDDDDDDTASQAITSGGEEEDEDRASESVFESRSRAPELVMPSLAMPARRPFTERGKQMGRLKIAVAGANGVGKTSLIRAIVRQCEDIVHLDPITTPTPTLQTPQLSKKSKRHTSSTASITEIQASTKAYPTWWSDMEESRVLRRRKSFGETVLERNISFIDSPGFSSKKDAKIEDQPLLKYLETLYQKNSAVSELGDSDLLGVLSGAGGVQVDLVLYICQGNDSLSEHDFDYMKRLSRFASVIPIIAKADTLPETALTERRNTMLTDLPRCGVISNLLSKPKLEAAFKDNVQDSDPQDSSSSHFLGRPSPQAPFIISCLPGSDAGEMDASLLMSPSYSPPLVPSDLQALVSMLFDPEMMAKLRHISARKFLAWREKFGSEANISADSMALSPIGTGLGIREQLALVRSTPQGRTSSPMLSSGALVARNGSQPLSSSPFNLSSTASIGQGLPDYTRARIRDHIMREERLAQVQLARWASDLQRGIRREREEFARLREGERAKWLLERVGEEVALGNLGVTGQGGESWALEGRSRSKRHGKRDASMELPSWAKTSREGVDVRDPLGLCGFGDAVGRTTNMVLKVLGGGVVVGAVWVAVCRAWGVEERWWVGWW